MVARYTPMVTKRKRIRRPAVVEFLLRNRQAQIGLVIVGGVVIVGLLAPLLAPYSPTSATQALLVPPSWAHWFGTDVSGLDILSRIMFAPRVDILIAVSATILAALVGIPLGVRAGFRRGIVSEGISRIFDVIQAFPFFILAITLLAAFGPSTLNLIIVVAVVNAPIYLRLMKSQCQDLVNRTFVDAARVSGCSGSELMFRHILPNALPPVLAQMSITIAWAIILTAGVSFVGAGIRAPTPEWGVMISAGAPNMMTGQWWVALFPGLVLALTVMGYGMLGNALTEFADPRSRRPS